VQQALNRAAVGVVPEVAVMLIAGLALALVAAILVGAPVQAGARAVLLLTIPLAVAVAIYVSIKLSLVPAVIVAERTANPLTLIRRSWRLTKGNSLRLLLFYALLFIPYMVIAVLAQGLFGAIGSLIGGQQGQLFVGGAASSLVGAAWGALNAAILAALYEQLSGRAERGKAETSE
jgi:hypothetical protein